MHKSRYSDVVQIEERLCIGIALRSIILVPEEPNFFAYLILKFKLSRDAHKKFAAPCISSSLALRILDQMVECFLI